MRTGIEHYKKIEKKTKTKRKTNQIQTIVFVCKVLMIKVSMKYMIKRYINKYKQYT